MPRLVSSVLKKVYAKLSQETALIKILREVTLLAKVLSTFKKVYAKLSQETALVKILREVTLLAKVASTGLPADSNCGACWIFKIQLLLAF